MTLRGSYRFSHRLRVRWAEVDLQQIVFNGHYLMYFDTAVGDYWRAMGLPYQAAMAQLGGDLYVRKTTVEYHASARYDDLLDIGIRCEHIGNASLRYALAARKAARRRSPDQRADAGQRLHRGFARLPGRPGPLPAVYKVTQAMGPSALDELSFFLLSLLSIRERATLEELNSFLLHTGMRATEPLMEGLENKGLVAIEPGETCAIYALTGQGWESALHQIALAKAVDQEISDRIGPGDAMALKLLLKRVIACSDPGLPDLWSTGSPSSR